MGQLIAQGAVATDRGQFVDQIKKEEQGQEPQRHVKHGIEDLRVDQTPDRLHEEMAAALRLRGRHSAASDQF